VTQIKMLEWKKTFECNNAKCRFQFQVVADVERDNIIEMPVGASQQASSLALLLRPRIPSD
jgi:hypothetical protein